jgi:hypothetical protein
MGGKESREAARREGKERLE